MNGAVGCVSLENKNRRSSGGIRIVFNDVRRRDASYNILSDDTISGELFIAVVGNPNLA